MGEIKGTDVFTKSLIQAPLQFAENMDKAVDSVDKLIDAMKKGEAATNMAKSTKEVKKQTDNLLGSEKELLKLQKQIDTQTSKLIVSRSDEAKKLAELKVRQTDRNKRLKEEAREARGLIGPYEKLNKQRTEASKRLKDLIASQKASTEEIEKAQMAFNQLDEQIRQADEAAKDFTKRVGSYEDAINSAAQANDAFNGSALDVIQNFIGMSQQEGGIRSFFQTFVGGINTATKAAIRFILTPIGAVITAIVAAIAAFTAVISRNEAASDKFNEVWEAGSAIIDVLAGRVIKLITAFGKFLTGDFAGAAEDVSDAFDNIAGSIIEAGKRGAAIARLTVEVEKLNTALKLTEASLEGSIRVFETVADDATRSFKEREDAAESARVLNIQLAREREELARTELELVDLQVKQAIEAGNINRELQDQQAEAIAKLITAEKEALAVELENEKTRRELKQDRLERDLDILIDGFDNIKTINERIIQDDKRVLAERQKRLEELNALSDKSFSKQIEVIKQFTKVQFDENALLAEQDAVILNEKIRSLGLSEIIEGRLLEIVRERRIVTSELVELQKSLNVQLTNEAVFLKNQRDVLIELNDALVDANEEVTDKYIDNIDRRIKAELAANQKRKEDAAKTEAEIAAKREEIIGNSVQLTIDLFSGFTQLRQQQIAQELQAVEFARNRELEASDQSERSKFEINKKFDDERKKLQKQQVIAERANALFQIAVNTAIGITSAAAAVATIPLIPFIAATGAIQAGLVLAQPVPQFDDGTESTPKDYVAGEKRPELRKSKGKWSLVNKPTLFKNSPGDTIVSGKETDSILSNMQDMTSENILNDRQLLLNLLNNDMRQEKPDQDLAYRIEKKLDSVEKTIKNKKEVDLFVSSRGVEAKEKWRGREITRRNKYYRI